MKAAFVLALIAVASAAVPSKPTIVTRNNVTRANDIYETPEDVQLIQAASTKMHESYNNPDVKEVYLRK
ncbi:unnamed protein product [Allacma fusca]|uniref:Uncharacterized protein n=1 Tax=Allacma fusca TaxID=39272 RepID=A0A8J2PNZ6_9HEXA|nr:unnamed protein product [Allacma fusca]